MGLAPRWHQLSRHLALERLATSEAGLGDGEARRRLAEHGPNTLPDRTQIGPVWLFLRQFRSPLLYVLMFAAALSIYLDHWVDAYVILTVIFVNAGIGFMQEFKAERALETLRRLNAPQATVVRDGTPRAVPCRALVPGDVVLIEAGSRVAADGRLLEAKALQVDESLLTGESHPIEKIEDSLAEENLPLGDRRNMVYMGTTVNHGRGSFVVSATGTNTEVGRIAEAVLSVEAAPSPLMMSLGRFSRHILLLAFFVPFAVVLIGIARGLPLEEVLLFALATAVSAIPEGLPAAVSIILAVGVQRMVRRHAIVRKLSAVETLGAATVICTDKTGTLTENRMKVVRAHLPGHPEGIPVGDLAPDGGVLAEPFSLLGRISCLCTDVREELDGDRMEVAGDPTEVALCLFAASLGFHRAELVGLEIRVAEVPFSSERKFMAVLVRDREGAHRLYVKGAPEVILARSSRTLERDVSVLLDDARREELAARSTEMSAEGLRVLGLAYRDVEAAPDVLGEDDAAGLTFVGFVGLMDPPRPGVAESVRECRDAGIRVIMLTGDHQVTAETIARRLGILEEDRPLVVTGRDVDDLDEEGFRRVLDRANVFARVSPHTKLRVVETLKAQGHVVAVTGDGVNDSPALKRADVGVAMGRVGTDVAREASEIVLADDNFTSVVNAVEEGRLAYKNIKRVVTFLLTTNVSEAVVLLSFLAVGFPLPLIAVQLLWINMVTATPSAMSLSLEPKHQGIMEEGPRPLRQGLLSRDVLHLMTPIVAVMLAGSFILFHATLASMGLESARTVIFTALVLFEMFNAFNCRSLRKPLGEVGLMTNRYLIAGFAAALVLQLFAVYHPWLQAVFQTVPLGLWDWIVILAVTPWVIAAGEMQKRVVRIFRPQGVPA
jgi:Ca2+-transporting ATPase